MLSFPERSTFVMEVVTTTKAHESLGVSSLRVFRITTYFMIIHVVSLGLARLPLGL